MPINKKLLFIHNSYPASGASGNVVFLRHFINLGPDWEIHILVPERLKNKMPDYYPDNFYISFLTERKWFWPPFREKFQILRWIWKLLLKFEIGKIIEKIGTVDAIITVLSHYTAEAAVDYASDHSIKSIVFLHDRWDLQNKNTDKSLSSIRKDAGIKILNKASVIFTVTRELAAFYNEEIAKKATILYPIPNGSKSNAAWKDIFYAQTNIVHTGTIDTFCLKIFDSLASDIMGPDDRLELIYIWMDFLDNLLRKFSQKIKIVEFFKKNEFAIEYVANNATAMLIYYGVDPNENMFAMDSFPSRFVEFAHTGVPIICIAPKNSAFHKFLKSENYSLLYSESNYDELRYVVEKLKNKNLWQQFSNETLNITYKYFKPEVLQNTFTNALS